MKTVRLHGSLARFIGQSQFKVDISSVSEAIRFLIANFPAAEAFIAKGSYQVIVESRDIGTEELHHPVADGFAVDIVPVIAGAGAVGRIILGVALVAVSFLIPGAAFFGVGLAPIAFGVGASLVLGGVAQLLTPTPRAPGENKDPKTPQSFSFSGIQNVSRQNIPLPIVCGEVIVGSIVIAEGLNTSAT